MSQQLALAHPSERLDPTASFVAPGPRRLGEVRRVVVKLGTRVLVDGAGEARLDRLADLARSVRRLRASGRQVLVVSSGAVGLGWRLLGLRAAPADAATRRACAAVGQGRLASLYDRVFLDAGLVTAQVLLQGDHFEASDAQRLRSTFETLLAAGVVPVVNENDAVGPEAVGPGAVGDEGGFHGRAFDDAAFQDNDGLSALVARRCDADLLLLLTDVAGVFADDPRRVPDAPLLERVDDAAPLLERLAGPADDGLSRGGMRSKVAAAARAAGSGCQAVIAGADLPCSLVERLVAGEALGTYFPATSSPASSPVGSSAAGAPSVTPTSTTCGTNP